MVHQCQYNKISRYKANFSNEFCQITIFKVNQKINHVWDSNKQIVADVIDNQFYEADCYIRGTNLAAKYNYQNGNKSEYTYYTQNAHGDVVNLTDKTGKVTKTYTYDAFGVEKNIDENDTNAFRYCGEYYDAETGTIYLRARYYNPSIGRFISRDSFAGKIEDPLSLNLYTYCANNPISLKDPTGHWFGLDDLIAAGVGAVVGVVSQVVVDVAQSVVTGDFKLSNWQTYTGAAVGGAIGGVTTLYAGPVAGSAVGAGATTLIGQTLENITPGGTKRSAAEILTNTAIDTGIGAVFGKFVPVNVNKVTSGRNSMNAVFKSGLTKIAHGNAKRMSSKVISKGITSGVVGGLSTSVALGSKNGFVEKYAQSKKKSQNYRFDKGEYRWESARKAN